MAISRVGANRALQGYLARRSAEREAELDRAARREEFMMNLLEKRKQYLLPELVKRFDSIKELETARRARITTAVNNYGISKKVALTLEELGQLGPQLAKIQRLDERNELAPNYIKDISLLAEERAASDEDLAAAIEAGLSGDSYTSDADFLKGYMAVVNATTQEDMMKGLNMSFLTDPRKQSKSFDPLDIRVGSGVAVDLTEVGRIQRQMAERLSATLGEGYNFKINPQEGEGSTDYIRFNDNQAQLLFNKSINAVTRMAQSPRKMYGQDFNTTSAVSYLVDTLAGIRKENPTNEALEYVVPLSKVNENFNTILETGPQTNWDIYGYEEDDTQQDNRT